MLEAASAGVIVGAVGAAVEVGAVASLNRTEGGSGVGGGILADSKSRTAAGAAGAGNGAAGAGVVSGLMAVASGPAPTTTALAAAGPAGPTGDGSGTGWPGSARPLRSRPHDWQLVCPRKIRDAPQKRHDGVCDPCPSVTLNLSSGCAPDCRALAACQYDPPNGPKDRRFGPIRLAAGPPFGRLAADRRRLPPPAQIDRPSACLPPGFDRPVG